MALISPILKPNKRSSDEGTDKKTEVRDQNKHLSDDILRNSIIQTTVSTLLIKVYLFCPSPFHEGIHNWGSSECSTEICFFQVTSSEMVSSIKYLKNEASKYLYLVNDVSQRITSQHFLVMRSALPLLDLPYLSNENKGWFIFSFGKKKMATGSSSSRFNHIGTLVAKEANKTEQWWWL